MLAFAGILSAAVIMSCQKEVEIDGAVETEKTYHSFMLDVSGNYNIIRTVNSYDINNNLITTNQTESKSLVGGEVSWKDYVDSNYKDYSVSLFYRDTNNVETQRFTIREMGGKFYFNKNGDSNYYGGGYDEIISSVTVTNPKEKSFTVKGEFSTRDSSYYPRVSLDLTFKRK